ncbi:subtype A tannase [Candidatus Oscillochloris fontis]|uniref:subtype A tannase n=1 Tax=Candidatus Oscillochloris fontis TaxID=2496868 RepID=UPI001EE91CF5|nr:subtype A tannase [Candidatus Oscillochloris fontis]
MKRIVTASPVLFLAMLVLLSLSACSGAPATSQPVPTAIQAVATPDVPVSPTTEPSPVTAAPTSTTTPDSSAAALTFNNTAWHYDADNDVYWQIGVQYAATPETLDYETLGIYVPGVYMTATANADGTYTAELNAQGSINGFTAQTAPIVLPINTAGYAAQKAPTEYSYAGLSSYLNAGFIYVYAGARGRANGYDASGQLTYSGGAPWGVTDFKAAIRFLRYNQAALPGNTDSIFVFGMSGGGAQSTLIGTTGDSELYLPYLESIGAAMYDTEGQPMSDAVAGVMAWCPITSLDYANEAYEWNMGQYAATETRAESTWTSALSKDLAAAYADYINTLGIKDEQGNVLTLEPTDSGIYTAGSYYDYLLATVEESLNNFLADTTFPYTATAGGFRPDGGFGGGAGQGGPPAGEMPQGTPPAGMMPGGASEASSTTYQTVQEYIDALNKDGEWVVYDATTNTAQITSLAGFVMSQKNPSKSVGAFDSLDRSQAENDVFGNDTSDALHFDSVLAQLLASNQARYATYADWDAAYVDAYATDIQALDKLGNSIAYRMNAYNPMYYLLPAYDGYQTATIAPHWRIRTGIKQGDTATTVEMNLALALKDYTGVEDVDFTTVWGQGHTLAERTGDATENFITWVVGVTQE